MGSSVRRSIAVLAALSMVFVGLLVSGATAATTTKPYSVDITPACVPLSTPGFRFVRNIEIMQQILYASDPTFGRRGTWW